MAERKNRSKKIFLLILMIFVVMIILSIWFQMATRVEPPSTGFSADTAHLVTRTAPGLSVCGNNWLKKGTGGNWEMYLEGNAFERGVIEGKLTRDLIFFQEEAFTNRISEMIPSPSYLRFLKYFIYWFNRDIDEYVPEEYKQEIYGISLSASKKFSYVGTNYQRMLNYHSAHDIGHALQEMKLVGCTSLGVWDGFSEDSSLIIGRNFDFYAGDEFSENKIIAFIKPSQGNAFMMVTWAGMAGAVSGMNEKGVTVTINAAKSEMPWSARTPVSILAREILQYAGNISEAAAIAEKRETFISESFLVGSAADHKAVIIEKSPVKTAIKESSGNYIICANHFQSAEYSNDPVAIADKKENASAYRQQRVSELITEQKTFNPSRMAGLLRDMKGLGGQDIGMGNEKAVNQLIAHHSVIFEPEKRLVWVSTSPWQMGSYTCYDLFKIFHIFAGLQGTTDISEADKSIPPDPFLESLQYKQFQRFKDLKNRITLASGSNGKIRIPEFILQEMIRSNPEFFEGYETAGDYFSSIGQADRALTLYRQALGKVIPRQKEKERIIEKMAELIILQKKKNG